MGGGARGGDGAFAAVGLPGFGRRRGGGADRCRRRRARAPEFRGRARVAELGLSAISSPYHSAYLVLTDHVFTFTADLFTSLALALALRGVVIVGQPLRRAIVVIVIVVVVVVVVVVIKP